MRRIVFDIETTGEMTGGSLDFTKQELTMVCIHDSKTGEFKSFLKEELSALWPILERADLLVGYNSEHFDVPILNRYYAGDLSTIPHVDLLKEVRAVLGRRLKMDNLAEATLGRKKIAEGGDAVRWWKEGNIDKIREYCIEDVRITKELYEHAKKHKSLKYKDFDGIRDIKLNTSHWEKGHEAPAMTHTLPF